MYYNVIVTLVTVTAAVLVGAIEAFALIGKVFDLKRLIWSALASVGERFDVLGFGVVALFLAIWIFAAISYRWKASASEVALPLLQDQADKSPLFALPSINLWIGRT